MFNLYFRKKNRDTFPDPELFELRHQLERARKELRIEIDRVTGWRRIATEHRTHAAHLLEQVTRTAEQLARAQDQIKALKAELELIQAERQAEAKQNPIVLGSALKRRLAELVVNGPRNHLDRPIDTYTFEEKPQ